jgi:hypothetical protein
MTRRPDFIADEFGNVEDVRHRKHPREICSRGRAESQDNLDAHRSGETGRYGATSQGFETRKKRATGSSDRRPGSWSSPAAGGDAFAILGAVLIFAGITLAIGNISGAFTTFPYAGCLIQFIGWAIVAASMKGLDGWK